MPRTRYPRSTHVPTRGWTHVRALVDRAEAELGHPFDRALGSIDPQRLARVQRQRRHQDSTRNIAGALGHLREAWREVCELCAGWG